MNKKYKNVKTGAEREFTEMHWLRLQKSFKAEWQEIAEFSTSEKSPGYTPPEIATGQAATAQPGSNEPVKEPAKEPVKKLTAQEMQLAQVKQLLSEGKNEKQIRELTGLHHSTVKSILAGANQA